nr:hypothetical protein [uncultured Pseudomonas sp.]
MLASQWTMEIIVISVVLAIASAVIGYFIAALRQGRQVSMLTAKLEQAQQGQAVADAQQTALQGQLKAEEAQGHNLQVEQGKLQTQLHAAADTATRLSADLLASKGTNRGFTVRWSASTSYRPRSAKPFRHWSPPTWILKANGCH